MKEEQFLRELFDVAVATADPMRIVPQHVPEVSGRLIVIGAGKASARMAEAVEAARGPCEGLVITRYGYARACKKIEIVEAAHPVPDETGVRATRRILDLVSSLKPADTVLALISGGGSALLCAPAFGMTLAEKQAINAALLASGAPIGDMNILRKHLSEVKGGQLAARCFPARVVSLLISDVPGDDPAIIASGPTVGDDSTVADAMAVAKHWSIKPPPHVVNALQIGSGVIRKNDPRLDRAETRIIAAPVQSLAAAREMAEQRGFDVRVLGDALEGEARDVGVAQARMALDIQKNLKGKPVLLLSGGELTVTRRGSGIGGPNAEFVLSAAIALDGAKGIHVLACDTDGVDGAAEVAGAIAGPDTLAKAGVSAEAALADNDSHTFFARAKAQVITGPTLTNVNDFRAVLISQSIGRH